MDSELMELLNVWGLIASIVGVISLIAGLAYRTYKSVRNLEMRIKEANQQYEKDILNQTKFMEELTNQQTSQGRRADLFFLLHSQLSLERFAHQRMLFNFFVRGFTTLLLLAVILGCYVFAIVYSDKLNILTFSLLSVGAIAALLNTLKWFRLSHRNVKEHADQLDANAIGFINSLDRVVMQKANKS